MIMIPEAAPPIKAPPREEGGSIALLDRSARERPPSAVVRHVRGASRGYGSRGIVIGDAAVYDAASRLVLGSFLAGSPLPTAAGSSSPSDRADHRNGVDPRPSMYG